LPAPERLGGGAPARYIAAQETRMTDQSDIRLARHFQVFIEDQVASGRFESASSLVEEALRLLERREAQEAALGRALREGLDSGDAVDFDMQNWLDEQDRLDERR
jgi:antitoxin ParD1/3/4